MLELEERNKDMEEILSGTLEILLEKRVGIKEIFEEQTGLIKDLKTLKDSSIITDIPDILIKAIVEIREDIDDGERLLQELIKELIHNKDYYIEFLEEKLKTFCEKECICNCCGTDLIYHYHNECVGEYQGIPAYEGFIDEGYCPYGCLTI